MNIIRKPCAAENFRSGRAGHSVEAVVIHIVDGGIAGCDATFASSSLTLRRSAHYCVAKTGNIHQYVDEQDTAFHAGRIQQPVANLKKLPDGTFVNPNLYTIGIEHEGFAADVWPPIQFETSATLLASISSRYPALATLTRGNVIMHREIFSAKSCPGSFIRLEDLIQRAKEIKAAVPGPAPTGVGAGGAAQPQPAMAPIRIITAVRVRQGAPAVTAPFVRTLPPSQTPITPLELIENGQSVSGISRWYRISADEFIWSGATREV